MSALPAVVGPVLLVTAQERGALFAQRAANGTLLGLVALSAFAFVYAWTSRHAGWPLSLAAGWTVAGFLGFLVGVLGAQLDSPDGLVAAGVSLLVAYRALPRASGPDTTKPLTRLRRDAPLRIVITALLVVALTGAARVTGPQMSGIAAALPVLASVLAVFIHREQGWQAVVRFLRGMLAGMGGFVAFCSAVAVLIVPAGISLAFTAAILACVSAQALTLVASHAGVSA